MAKDFEDEEVGLTELGESVVVQNLYKKKSETSTYINMRFRLPNGTLINGLWTTDEFLDFSKLGKDRAEKQPEDVPVDGFIMKLLRGIFG